MSALCLSGLRISKHVSFAMNGLPKQVQIISYTVLLVKSPKRGIDNVCQASVTFQPVEGTLCDIDTRNGSVPVEAMYDGAEAVYTISSIAVANLLVVIFAAGDLRGAIALLQTWTSRNVALGLGMLTSFVLLVISSASVLFFVSNDDVSFIVGAAAVLFISDLVRNYLSFTQS